MRTAAEYRQFAQECMDNARVATSAAARVQFLELAQLWLSAATQVERKSNGDASWSNSGGRPSQEADASK
jgi:hypothetical protein